MFRNESLFTANFGRPYPLPEELASVKARKLFSFAGRSEGLHLLRFDIGASDDPILSFYNFDELHRRYPESVSSADARFKIIHYRDENLIEVEINEIPGHGAIAQAFGDGRYLIASRSGGTNFPNAWIVDIDGTVLEKFPIGDAIEAVQTTTSGNIWTGYCDEGVFGNDPVSQKVFACFDRHGKLLFPDECIEGFGDWCVGLNVESENCVWLLPSRGPLVKVEDFSITKICNAYKALGGIFAIFGNYTCWASPMYSADSGIDFFVILDLGSGRCRFFQVIDEHYRRIDHQHYAARGSKLYFVSNYDVYVLDLNEIDSLPELLRAGFSKPLD